jgi:hypothetical protein
MAFTYRAVESFEEEAAATANMATKHRANTEYFI